MPVNDKGKVLTVPCSYPTLSLRNVNEERRLIVLLLRKLRLERGWSGFELARLSQVNQSDVSALELGRRIPPDGSPTLQRLADALAFQDDPSALLREVDGEPA
jgi:transcriptional regulator with XRE-family HTH domain